nr:MAG TPA_asm: hypothetical protein [Caudoviricetes sp.]
MAELRAGGLALIIKSISSKEDGRVVTCVEKIYPGGTYSDPKNGQSFQWEENQPAWIVTGDVAIYISSIGSEEIRPDHGWSIYLPNQLMPIDGDDFSNEAERQKEREHA